MTQCVQQNGPPDVCDVGTHTPNPATTSTPDVTPSASTASTPVGGGDDEGDQDNVDGPAVG